MLFVMLSKTGAKYVLPMMWIILVADLLFGSILFALIQGGLLAWYYHQRRQLARGPARPPLGRPLAGPQGPRPGMRTAGACGPIRMPRCMSLRTPCGRCSPARAELGSPPQLS